MSSPSKTSFTGTGTVQLQMKMSDDWVPADTAITASMESVEVADAASIARPRIFRWNCSAHSGGTIHCYLG